MNVDLDAALIADSSLVPNPSFSFALGANLVADSSLSPVLSRAALMTCAITGASALSITAMDVTYTPPPNVPVPLPVPAAVPLRLVPSPPFPASTTVKTPTRTVRQRFD